MNITMLTMLVADVFFVGLNVGVLMKGSDATSWTTVAVVVGGIGGAALYGRLIGVMT